MNDLLTAGATFVEGYGVRSPIVRRLGAGLFLAAQWAATALFVELDVGANPNHPQGYAAPMAMLDIGLVAVWFALSRRRVHERWLVVLAAAVCQAWVLSGYLPELNETVRISPMMVAVATCGYWLGPLFLMLRMLRSAGLRIVCVGESVVTARPIWRLHGSAIAICVGLQAASAFTTFWFLGANLHALDWRQIAIPLAIGFVGAALGIFGLPAALGDRGAARWLGVLAAAVAGVWLMLLGGYAVRGDLTWIRVWRDTPAAFLGFVPYLNFLWFRALGYRVVTVAE
ncbi:MAG: hypothetical protein DCC68_17765 [Planctomycetota bacterium]|nr:MAG: hypothetical protein DCC68_17765 [Planctomycetota bacterium]